MAERVCPDEIWDRMEYRNPHTAVAEIAKLIGRKVCDCCLDDEDFVQLATTQRLSVSDHDIVLDVCEDCATDCDPMPGGPNGEVREA